MSYKWEGRIDWDVLRDKKILIAGGTGFIGKRVVKVLEEHGVRATVLTRNAGERSGLTEYRVCDLCDAGSLEGIAGKYEILVYLAANIPLRGSKKESYQDALNTTLVPFVNFATAFVREGTKLIYASSVDVLGACGIWEFTEEALPAAATPYGLAKYCGEYYANDICASQKAECAVLRFAQVYGPDEPVVRLIPIVRDAILNDKKFDIWTDGMEKRRFLYVDDAVQALFLCMGAVPQGIYNVAGNDVVSVKQLVEMMAGIFEKDFKYEVLGRTQGVDNVPGIRKAAGLLGFVPEVSLRDGLKAVKGEGQ